MKTLFVCGNVNGIILALPGDIANWVISQNYGTKHNDLAGSCSTCSRGIRARIGEYVAKNFSNYTTMASNVALRSLDVIFCVSSMSRGARDLKEDN